MRDIDDLLNRLAQLPVPAGLADVERRVLGSILGRIEARNGAVRELPLAGLAALMLGIAGGALQSSGPTHASIEPADINALAPSELLGDAVSETLL